MNHAETLSLASTAQDGWIAVATNHMPPVEAVVIGWHGEYESPVAAFYDTSGPGGPQWSAKSDGEAFPVEAITHWRYCARPDEANPTNRVLVIGGSFGSLHIAENEYENHISMRTAEMAAILRLMLANDPDNFMISLCARLASELCNVHNDKQTALLLTRQLAEIFLSEPDDKGPGALMWLCQQIADELRCILGAMIEGGRP